MEVDHDDQQEAHTSIYEDTMDFGYFNMANGMLMDIPEELRDKFPTEGRVRFSQLNTIYLAARSSQMKRFVEALNAINSTDMQTYLVNTVSVCVCGRSCVCKCGSPSPLISCC